MTGTISEAPDDGEGAAIAAPGRDSQEEAHEAPVSSFENEGMGKLLSGTPRTALRACPRGAQRVPDCLHFSKK